MENIRESLQIRLKFVKGNTNHLFLIFDYAMQPSKKAKITFSPSNIDEYERAFRIQHDIVMGYSSPLVPRVKSIVDVMNETFPVPSSIHVPFRRWIEHNHLARFDCFQKLSCGYVNATNV